MSDILPRIFFGHGNPMNALIENPYTEAWRRIGADMDRPRAILSISAHWFVPGTGVTIGRLAAVHRVEEARPNIE